MTIKLAKTKKEMKDDSLFPYVQITYLEKLVDSLVCESYGTHGSPPKNSPCLLFCLNGNEANRFIIPLSAFDRNKNLKEGEFETGNFKVGSVIKFDEDGNINITTEKDVVISANQVTTDCDIIVTGGDVVADGISLKTHTHPLPDLETSVTVVPGGPPTGAVTGINVNTEEPE
jgi:phage gp45-like